LLVLLAGGLVVSTKIGGGSNLHNLDAYLTLLLVVGGWCYYTRTNPDDVETTPTLTPGEPAARLPWIGLLYILLLPVYITLLSGPVTPPVDRQRVDVISRTLGRLVIEELGNFTRRIHLVGW